MARPLRHVRSWYGLPAEIGVEDGLWHLVRVGGLALHHPPLVNLLLRRGQPRRERLYLSFLHEFGHLQTLPVAVGHVLWLLVYGRFRGRGFLGKFMRLTAVVIAHEAVWELASESYVMVKARGEYGRIYRQYPNKAGQLIFWAGMTFITFALTYCLTKRVEKGQLSY